MRHAAIGTYIQAVDRQIEFQRCRFELRAASGIYVSAMGDPCAEGRGTPVNMAGEYRPLRANCPSCGAPGAETIKRNGRLVCSYCRTPQGDAP